MSRISWDEYFMEMAHLAARRTTCLRRAVGAVIVKDKRVIATGYNGVASGLEHCEKVGCLREELKVPSGQQHELCRAVHAEQNALIQAARMGISVEGASIYVTTYPCIICAKMLVGAGIKKIYTDNPYPDPLTGKLTVAYLKEAGIKVEKIKRKEVSLG